MVIASEVPTSHTSGLCGSCLGELWTQKLDFRVTVGWQTSQVSDVTDTQEIAGGWGDGHVRMRRMVVTLISQSPWVKVWS